MDNYNQNSNFVPPPTGETKVCPYCRSQIDKKASICPHCRKSQPNSANSALSLICCIFVVLWLFTHCGKSDKKDTTSTADRSNISTNSVSATIETTKEEVSETENNNSDNAEAETTVPDNENITPENNEEPNPEEQITENEQIQESNIKIVSYSLSKDYDDKDVLVIEYAYTCVKDKATSFSFACNDKVFQNGIECNSSVFGCDEVDTQQQLNDVQPGATYNLKVGYLLQDMTNAQVIVTDYWGDNTLAEQVIELGGGDGAVVSAENLQDTYVKIIGFHMSKDYEDKDVLVVDYEYYNGSDEAESFIWNFTAKAFQNGVECDDTVIGCDDINDDNFMNDIQPGVTVTANKGYHITDMSDVTIEVKGLWNDKEYATETISFS